MIRCLPPEPETVQVRQIRCTRCQRQVQYDGAELSKATFTMFLACPNCNNSLCDVYAKNVEVKRDDWSE